MMCVSGGLRLPLDVSPALTNNQKKLPTRRPCWALRFTKIRLQRSEAWRSSIEEKVIGIVSEQLNIPKEDIKLNSDFVSDLKADSLDLVELVMEFEDEFGVQIPESDQEKIKSVGDAVKYITEKQ